MKEQSTSRGVFVLTLAGIVVKILSLLYIPILINILTAPGHGIYAKTYDIFIFGYVVTNDSITKTLSKSISELQGSGRNDEIPGLVGSTLRMMLIVSSLMGLAFFFLAPTFSAWSDSPDTLLGIRILALVIPFTAVVSVYRGYFQGMRTMTPNAYSQVWEQLANSLSSLIFAALLIRYGMMYGVAGGTLGTLMGSLISLIYLLYSARKWGYKVGKLKDNEIFRRLLRYLTPLVLGTLFQQLGLLADVFNVSQQLRVAGFSSMQSETFYSHLSSYRNMINVPTVGIGAIAIAVLPAVSNAFSRQDEADLHQKMTQALRAVFLWAIPCSFGISGLALVISRTLYDASVPRSLLMLYGGLVVAIYAVGTIQTILLQAAGRYWAAIGPLTVGLIVKIIANYFLVAIPSVNIMGAVWSTYLSAIVSTGLNTYYVRKYYDINLNYWKLMKKPLFAGLAMFAFLAVSVYTTKDLALFQTRLPNSLWLGFLILAGALIYGLILIKSQGLYLEDIRRLSPGLARRLPAFIQKRLAKDENVV